MGNNRRSLRHKKENDSEIKRLRNTLRRLESDKRKLLSELKTLEEAFGKTINHVKGRLDSRSVEEVIRDVNKGKTLPEIEKTGKTRDWTCKKCKNGELHYIEINRHDGDWYVRRCNNKDCKSMTRMKKLVEGVDKYNGKK